MSSQAAISREEWERLLRDVEALKNAVEDLINALKPFMFLLDRLPHVMADPQVFKAVVPILAMPYAMERANPNVLGAAMVEGMACLGKALEDVGSRERVPAPSLLSLLRDREAREALGIMMEILKKTAPCLHKGLQQVARP